MSNKPFRIVIVDDEHERSTAWAREINELPLGESLKSVGFDAPAVEAISKQQAGTMLSHAEDRRSGARSGANPFAGSVRCELDSIDVLVVDFDLQEFVDDGQWSTGLQIAQLARAYSRVGTIVLVNQYATNSFDLTMVKAAESPADLDIGSAQISNPALWIGTPQSEFSPWAWMDGAIRLSDRLKSTLSWVTDRLDDQALSCLGFTTNSESFESPTYLPRDIWERLIQEPSRTFRQLAVESSLLGIKDRKPIESFDESCARIATATLIHWFDRCLIPSGDALADLPHLASAYPWLLKDAKDPGCWQATTGGDDGFRAFHDGVLRHQYSMGFPLAKPAVLHRAVLNDPELAEPAGFSYDDFPDFVFCEDVSRFLPFEQARAYESDVCGPHKQRFVSRSTEERASSRHATTNVAYEPSVRFSI